MIHEDGYYKQAKRFPLLIPSSFSVPISCPFLVFHGDFPMFSGPIFQDFSGGLSVILGNMLLACLLDRAYRPDSLFFEKCVPSAK